MEAGYFIFIIIFICITFPLMLLGGIIYRGNVELIAGYDPNKVTDKEGLAKWVGSNIIFLGLYTRLSDNPLDSPQIGPSFHKFQDFSEKI